MSKPKLTGFYLHKECIASWSWITFMMESDGVYLDVGLVCKKCKPRLELVHELVNNQTHDKFEFDHMNYDEMERLRELLDSQIEDFGYDNDSAALQSLFDRRERLNDKMYSRRNALKKPEYREPRF